MRASLEESIIGLDLGTSACKAVLVTPDGRMISSARKRYRTRTTADGTVVQRPRDWVSAACAALAQVAQDVKPRRLRAIGLSGQLGTHVLLDEHGFPLGPAVTWQDSGSSVMLERVEAAFSQKQLNAESGHSLPASPMWPLPRLLWLRAKWPRRFERATTIAQPKDFVLRGLCGELLSDASTWRGLVRPDGSVIGEALDALDLPDLLPDIAPATHVVGPLLDKVATATGLPAGTPVTVGWNDFNCSLLGAGVTSAGQLFDIAGTSEHVGQLRSSALASTTVASFRLDPDLGDHGLFAVYGVTSNSGGLLDWLRGTLVSPNGAVGSLQQLEHLAATAPAGADGLLCLPYLYGERSPVWDSQAAGAFVGLRHAHERHHLIRAVLEGGALNLRQILDAIPGALPAMDVIRTAGGPVLVRVWNEIKASVLGAPIAVIDSSDSAALGAAALAAAAVGIHPTPPAAALAMAAPSHTVEPREELVSIYDELYPRFVELYPAVKPFVSRNRKEDRPFTVVKPEA